MNSIIAEYEILSQLALELWDEQPDLALEIQERVNELESILNS